MKLMLIAAVAVLLTACAGPRAAAPKALACQTEPQWHSTDAQGKPASDIFVCFGDKGELLYTVKPAAPVPAAAPPKPVRKGPHK